MSPSHQDELLTRLLGTLLGELDASARQLLKARLAWHEIPAGATLMRQGDPGAEMYLVVSGRLRAYVLDDGTERMVREMGRGQIVGEMSLYTDEPRSATVIAIRDSVLVRLSKADFNQLLASSAQASIALTRQIIQRLQKPQDRAAISRPVVITLLPITSEVDAQRMAQRLADCLRPMGSVRVVDFDDIGAVLNLQEVGTAAKTNGTDHRISMHIDDIEATHEYVLLVADGTPTPWTHFCCRHCDEVLLLANARQPPRVHASELQCLMQRPGRLEALETLVLLHAADATHPRGTGAWLHRRPVAGHLHIRPDLDRDMARLARILSGTAVGLVFAGGGARGFAHLGVYRALQERGIEIDCVGGTSIGAVMALLVATDQPVDRITALARKCFLRNPTGDFTFFPLLSLISGRRLRQIIATAAHELLGDAAQIEDLWKNFYCVASNYSQAREQVVQHGDIVTSLLASTAIPGALPPVIHDGDLLCDGGTFNSFPVNIMRARWGVGHVIGVDLNVRKPRRLEIDEIPSGWRLLLDRLRPRKYRRYRLPSLISYLLNVSILYSSSRQREYRKLIDLYFNPPLERVGMLQWHRFDEIVAKGHAHACEVLGAPEA